MQSEKLGALFEKATLGILRELFECWGFQLAETKLQRSGTQHGFDVYFRITKNHINLSLFVECKASNSFNYIEHHELSEKVAQLNWANFSRKDVHIFFSPTRAADLNNQRLSIEDNSWPFVIVDWMRKEVGDNLPLELFAAYRKTGQNQEVLDYCDFLSSNMPNEFSTDRSFAEVCAQLNRHFERRIEEHNAASLDDNYRIINGTFWSRIQQNSSTEARRNYYTKTDARPTTLEEVVANDLCIKNELVEKEFDQTLNQATQDKFALIKILSRGGEGKSTFLYRIARLYCQQHTVVSLDDIPNMLSGLQERLQRLQADGAIILLLDNAALHGQELKNFAYKLNRAFRKQTLILVVAEREFRYQHIEDLKEFEAAFNNTYSISYRAGRLKPQVFDELIIHLQTSNPLTEELIKGAKSAFLDDPRKSISESVFAVISYLREKTGLQGYSFDWEDWERFARKNASDLERLYLVLATFYQFGFGLKTDFCVGFLRDVDEIRINTVLGDSKNLPIYRRGRYLFLRHETIATWYLDESSPQTRRNHINSELVFKDFLQRVNTDFSRDLFIRLCIKNKDFRRSYLSKFLDDSNRANLLLDFITQYPKELKCRTELSKIYQRQKRWLEAKATLLELLERDPNNLHARTELSKIYQRQKKWQAAEDILLELLRLDPENLHTRTELSKIYQWQKKWQAAEDILLECLTIAPDDLNSRTELSKIYQRTDRKEEAETLLRECLQIDPDDPNSMLELGKICVQDQARWNEAEQFFNKVRSVEPDNLHAKTELSALYAKMKMWGAREKILFEIYEQNPEDIPTLMELARTFSRFRKYRVTLKLLDKTSELRRGDLLTTLELIQTFAILRDQQNLFTYLQQSEEIIRRDPYNKHLDRFHNKLAKLRKRFDLEACDGGIPLLNLNEIGTLLHMDGQVYVEKEGKCYLLDDTVTINNRLRHQDKVFFATYARNEGITVDFVEPYFDGIENLSTLR